MKRENPEEIFQTARPGSRTILFGFQDFETVVHFARRGFRLFVVTENSDELKECRTKLRSLGLASQLMGGAVGPEPTLSLARNFYELVVVCSENFHGPTNFEDSLRIGCEVYWIGSGWECFQSWQNLTRPGDTWNRARLIQR